jgi:hypothetical protein
MSTFPTTIVPNAINFVAKTQATSFTSPFGGQQQVVRYSGQWWELDLRFPPLFHTQAETLSAFLNSLGGSSTSFYFNLPSKFFMS